jgi:hypothetical protein
MSGRQAALPIPEETGIQIILIYAWRTVAATRRDLRQNGGSRSLPTATPGNRSDEASGRGQSGRRPAAVTNSGPPVRPPMARAVRGASGMVTP